ncbi:class I SAM-dependent methyltransferase [Candidatus Xianfuyuplasma coldseepsis]|uniref:Methyltransferase domain-containing protein n=1 Tax=Candidatus Xianfuyuplasma coldseepsis TaxID=2782163 RepID=A0A7L7KQ65_9MOLU|nr:methyltransferase domain-containing protein [Xianfuyuplasma coldseepsis]QMS84827.1 methyltransferase domain-containing protein [Xianfuyuplasma coldseepsis]
MSSYNKYYKKANYFGKPYPELIRYFDRFDRSSMILDVGCGQGRDTLELGRMGFSVRGIDISDVGINQLNEIATKEKLDVVGEVTDYKDFASFQEYDIILMNSMFHFYKNDIAEETRSINRIIDKMKNNARFVLIVQESGFRVKHLNEIITKSKHCLEVDYQETFLYQEFNSYFHFVSIKKVTI